MVYLGAGSIPVLIPISSSPCIPRLSLLSPMPFTFHCGRGPPTTPLPPIPIPGMDGVMSNDGVAVVFKLDPRLQQSPRIRNHKMAPREGSFLDSIRASFSSKNLRVDHNLDSRFKSKNDKRRKEKGKGKEIDSSFMIAPRSSSSSLVHDKSSILGTTLLPPPLPRREDRLPKHANIFTGIPTPTESALTSARNSQYAPSKPGTPVNERSLRPSRSVPDWTPEQRRQYRYFQDGMESELPRVPTAFEPQPAPEEATTAEIVTRGGEIFRDGPLKLSSIGRYKKNWVAFGSGGDDSLVQQRASMRDPGSSYLGGSNDTPETPNSFLVKDGPGNNMNGHSGIPVPARKQLLQQRPDHCPNSQNQLSPHHQIRRRSTAPAGAADDDQRRSLSTSQSVPDRPTSTSTYQAHRGHSLYPVVEETPPSILVSNWSGEWSPHLQQGSELFFETGMYTDLAGSGSPASVTPPVVEMGIPSPQTKARPASWACPIRPVVGGGIGLTKSEITCPSHELDIMFPPTPPSSAGDVWDDCHIDQGVALVEHHLFWELLRHLWNVFILIWALLLIFKSVQFITRATELVILEPIKVLGNVLRKVVES